MTDDEFFASFAQDINAVFKKHFGQTVQCAIGFAVPPNPEVRYIMSVDKSTGIAIFEQAADLARSEMEDNTPKEIFNPEKYNHLAQQMLDGYSGYENDAYAHAELVRIMMETLTETERQPLAIQTARNWLKQYVNSKE